MDFTWLILFVIIVIISSILNKRNEAAAKKKAVEEKARRRATGEPVPVPGSSPGPPVAPGPFGMPIPRPVPPRRPVRPDVEEDERDIDEPVPVDRRAEMPSPPEMAPSPRAGGPSFERMREDVRRLEEKRRAEWERAERELTEMAERDDETDGESTTHTTVAPQLPSERRLPVPKPAPVVMRPPKPVRPRAPRPIELRAGAFDLSVDAADLRRAIILAEILDRPVGFRERPEPWETF